MVEVGREVTVTANLCSAVGEQQEAEKGFKALFLCVGAGVGGTSGSIQTSFVGNSYRRGVVAFGVGSDVGDVAHVVYRSVFGDVIVIATFGKTLAFVHGVEGFRGEVACARGCGAVHHNQGDVSLFNHCFLWVIMWMIFSCVFLFYPPSVPLWGRRLSGEVLFPLAAGRSPSEEGSGCSRRSCCTRA